MTFAENRQSDMDDVLLNITEFGEVVSYTVSGGSAKSIKAVIDRNVATEITKRPTGTWTKYISIVQISKDSTNGIANPGEDDFVTIDSKKYDVEKILEEDTESAILKTIFIEILEYSAEDYREDLP